MKKSLIIGLVLFLISVSSVALAAENKPAPPKNVQAQTIGAKNLDNKIASHRPPAHRMQQPKGQKHHPAPRGPVVSKRPAPPPPSPRGPFYHDRGYSYVYYGHDCGPSCCHSHCHTRPGLFTRFIIKLGLG